MAAAPDTVEVQEFIESVNEVSLLIEGLKAGTISPEYIDRQHGDKLRKDQKQPEAVPAAGKLTVAPSKQPAQKAQPSAEDAAAAAKAKEEEEERKERLMEKARELKANRERKLKAREKYDQYVQSCQDQTSAATDYRKWDMWCPEDEEDDLINSLTPNNPAFRALEKDIDERHHRMVEQRQIAERQRAAGNEAFKQGQFSEALRCYQAGLESEKTNMALHANAAQAALKVNCFVQAVEHCDKVLNIADFLHNNTKTELCAKAYMRRASAYRALGQYERAVRDLEEALSILPGDKELGKLKAKADLDLSEYQKQKQLSKVLKTASAATAASPGPQGSTAAFDVDKLRQVEQLVVQLKETGATGNGGADSTATAASSNGDSNSQHSTAAQQQAGAGTAGRGGTLGAHGPQLPAPKRGKAKAVDASGRGAEVVPGPIQQLQGLLGSDDACCVYFRECGGISAAADRVIRAVSQDSERAVAAQDITACLILVNTAATNDGNLLQAAHHKGLLLAVLQAAASKDAALCTAATSLLCTLSTLDEARALISACFTHVPSPLGGLLKALRTAPAHAPHRALLLLLLSNCAVDAACRTGLRATVSTPVVAQALVTTLEGCVGSSTTAEAERACTLIANMCGDATLRTALLVHGSLAAVAAKCVINTAEQLLAGQGLQPACKAAATALYNLTVEAVAQEAVVSAGLLPGLLKLCSGMKDWTLRSLLVGSVARCMKFPAAAAAATQQDALATLLQVITDCTGQPPDCAESAAVTSTLDGAVRAVTVLVSGGDSPAAAEALLAAGGAQCMRVVLSCSLTNIAALGNAALCVANIAKHSALLSPLASVCKVACVDDDGERAAGVPNQREAAECLVAGLVRAAYVGQGGVAAKNAGIALARLAAHTPLLARLKELRGLEIIHASVKSI